MKFHFWTGGRFEHEKAMRDLKRKEKANRQNTPTDKPARDSIFMSILRALKNYFALRDERLWLSNE